MLKYDKIRYFLKTLILVNRIKWTQIMEDDPNNIVLCLLKFFFSFSSLIFEKKKKNRFFSKINKITINMTKMGWV